MDARERDARLERARERLEAYPTARTNVDTNDKPPDTVLSTDPPGKTKAAKPVKAAARPRPRRSGS